VSMPDSGRSPVLPHGVALITGLGAAIGLINARVNEWVSGWTVVVGIVLLMFSPALAAAVAAILSKMSTIEMRRLLVPYLWFGVGGCAALGFLALVSQAGSETEGIVRRGSIERNVSFLFLLAVYFGVPIGVPLVRIVGSLRGND